MSKQSFLIINDHDEHFLAEQPPFSLLEYREYGGPYNGIVPFHTVFAKASVSPDRVAHIASNYIGQLNTSQD